MSLSEEKRWRPSDPPPTPPERMFMGYRKQQGEAVVSETAQTDWHVRYEQVERDYADYAAAVRADADVRGTIPHCDSWVLHSPRDDCAYCNERPNLQAFRLQQQICFTGHSYPTPAGWRPCPAEVLRPVEQINRWHGNAAATPAFQAAMEQYYAELREALGRCAEDERM